MCKLLILKWQITNKFVGTFCGYGFAASQIGYIIIGQHYSPTYSHFYKWQKASIKLILQPTAEIHIAHKKSNFL